MHEQDDDEQDRPPRVDLTDPTGYLARLREAQDVPADLRWAYAYDPTSTTGL